MLFKKMEKHEGEIAENMMSVSRMSFSSMAYYLI